MGYAILRQVRVNPNTCRVHPSFHNTSRVCALGSSISNEDTRNYCDAWEEENNLTVVLPSCKKEVGKFGLVLHCKFGFNLFPSKSTIL